MDLKPPEVGWVNYFSTKKSHPSEVSLSWFPGWNVVSGTWWNWFRTTRLEITGSYGSFFANVSEFIPRWWLPKNTKYFDTFWITPKWKRILIWTKPQEEVQAFILVGLAAFLSINWSKTSTPPWHSLTDSICWGSQFLPGWTCYQPFDL